MAMLSNKKMKREDLCLKEKNEVLRLCIIVCIYVLNVLRRFRLS